MASALHARRQRLRPPASTRADEPIELADDHAVLRASTFFRGQPVGASSIDRTFTKLEPLPPTKRRAVGAGPARRPLRRRLRTCARRPRRAHAGRDHDHGDDHRCPSDIGEHVLLRHTGLLTVPQDGLYHFVLTSDDGSRLEIDGVRVVDHDGLHGPTEEDAARSRCRPARTPCASSGSTRPAEPSSRCAWRPSASRPHPCRRAHSRTCPDRRWQPRAFGLA
jgi:hypothetical protein